MPKPSPPACSDQRSCRLVQTRSSLMFSTVARHIVGRSVFPEGLSTSINFPALLICGQRLPSKHTPSTRSALGDLRLGSAPNLTQQRFQRKQVAYQRQMRTSCYRGKTDRREGLFITTVSNQVLLHTVGELVQFFPRDSSHLPCKLGSPAYRSQRLAAQWTQPPHHPVKVPYLPNPRIPWASCCLPQGMQRRCVDPRQKLPSGV